MNCIKKNICHKFLELMKLVCFFGTLVKGCCLETECKIVSLFSNLEH